MQISPKAVSAALVAAAGFALLYSHVLVKLVHDWATDDNYSHGFLIVPIALYFAWERRHALAALPGTAVVARSPRRRWCDRGPRRWDPRCRAVPDPDFDHRCAGRDRPVRRRMASRASTCPATRLSPVDDSPSGDHLQPDRLPAAVTGVASRRGKHFRAEYPSPPGRQRHRPGEYHARSRGGVQRHPVFDLLADARDRLRLFRRSPSVDAHAHRPGHYPDRRVRQWCARCRNRHRGALLRRGGGGRISPRVLRVVDLHRLFRAPICRAARPGASVTG